MKSRSIIMIVVLLFATLACSRLTVSAEGENTPAAGTAAPAATAAPAVTQAPAAATEAPIVTPEAPTATPTITLTPTPSAPMVTPIKDPVNCRFSYTANYESIGPGLAVGASAPILGKSPDAAWWEIQNPAGTEKCWVAASVTTATGDLSSVPVVMGPSAFVTNVTMLVKPPSINLGIGCPGPAPLFSLKGTIWTNGPVTVKWHFETQKGGALSTHSTTFTKYGPMDVSDSYSPASLSKGTYWVKLVITSPITMTAQDSYQLLCQ